MNDFVLTKRDTEIVETLALMVRLMGQRQIADHWWAGELPNARRRLRRLADQDLITRIDVQARPTPTIQSPLLSWQPGQPDPDFGSIAYRSQARFRRQPVRRSTAWIATERGAQLFGGARRGTLKHPTQATHDLGVAAVWLRLAATAPQWAAAWRGEDLLAHTREGEKLPDAFFVNASDEIICAVEFVIYSAERIQAFHEDCVGRNLPYQLW